MDEKQQPQTKRWVAPTGSKETNCPSIGTGCPESSHHGSFQDLTQQSPEHLKAESTTDCALSTMLEQMTT